MTGAKSFIQCRSTQGSCSLTPQSLCAEDYIWLVGAMLRRFPHSYCEAEDLYQQGCLGLMKAINRFDPAYGSSFVSYAAAMIIGEMRMLSRLTSPVHIPRSDRELRARIRRAIMHLKAKLSREPTIQELSVLLKVDPAELALMIEDVCVTSADAANEYGSSLWECIPASDAWLDQVEIRDLIGRLPTRDQLLMQFRFYQGLSQSKTAQLLSMTQVQISRRERVLIKMLRDQWLHTTA